MNVGGGPSPDYAAGDSGLRLLVLKLNAKEIGLCALYLFVALYDVDYWDDGVFGDGMRSLFFAVQWYLPFAAGISAAIGPTIRRKLALRFCPIWVRAGSLPAKRRGVEYCYDRISTIVGALSGVWSVVGLTCWMSTGDYTCALVLQSITIAGKIALYPRPQELEKIAVSSGRHVEEHSEQKTQSEQ